MIFETPPRANSGADAIPSEPTPTFSANFIAPAEAPLPCINSL